MDRARMWGGVHAVVGFVACALIPIATWLVQPEGGLAWRMFARVRHYRLQLTAVGDERDAARRRNVPVIDVARALGAPQGALVAGLEAGVDASATGALRRTLPELARIACGLDAARGARVVEAVLEERDLGAEGPRVTEVTVSCRE